MRNISAAKLEFISIILKAISHPLRLRIVEILETTPKMNVQDISQALNHEVEQSLLSHHLIKMRDKGILNGEKEGVYVYYSLRLKEVTTMLNCMENCPY